MFATSGLDIKSLIRNGESVEEVISNLWQNRTDKYSEIRTIETRELRKKVEMSYIEAKSNVIKDNFDYDPNSLDFKMLLVLY